MTNLNKIVVNKTFFIKEKLDDTAIELFDGALNTIVIREMFDMFFGRGQISDITTQVNRKLYMIIKKR